MKLLWQKSLKRLVKEPILEKDVIDSKTFPLLEQDKTIVSSIIGLGVFWAISQIVVAIFAQHLKSSLNETNTIISQGILAFSGIGIVIGSIYSGYVSKSFVEKGILAFGVLLMALSLIFIPFSSSILSYLIEFFIYGFGAGYFYCAFIYY